MVEVLSRSNVLIPKEVIKQTGKVVANIVLVFAIEWLFASPTVCRGVVEAPF